MLHNYNFKIFTLTAFNLMSVLLFLAGSTGAERKSRHRWVEGQEGKSCHYLRDISCTTHLYVMYVNQLNSDYKKTDLPDPWLSVSHHSSVPINQRLKQLKDMCLSFQLA